MAGSSSREVGSEVLNVIQCYLRSNAERKVQTLGYLMVEGTWRPTAESSRQPRVTAAIDYIIKYMLQIDNVFAARVGRGIPRFPACEEACQCVIIWWKRHIDNAALHYFEGAPAISTTKLAGDTWPKAKYLQMLLSNQDDQAPPLTGGHAGGIGRAWIRARWPGRRAQQQKILRE